jgi:hypothetical protein
MAFSSCHPSPFPWFFFFNNNGLVDHVLEIRIVGVEQLELNVIIQSIKEHILLLLISVDVFVGVSWHLNEWVEVLIHCHAALFQVSKLLLQFYSATGHIVGMETSLELVPRARVDVCVGVAVRFPLVGYRSKELVRGKKNFLKIRALGDHELLLNSLKPIFGFH